MSSLPVTALHDSAKSETEQGPQCSICSAETSNFFSLGHDRLFGLADGSFRLYCCVTCGCVFQHPLPPLQVLQTFYPREYWWTEELDPAPFLTRITARLEEAYRRFVNADHVRFVERCARTQPGGRTLLDIGCGNGTFLDCARRWGFVPHGMDISPRAVEIARQRYGLEVRLGEVGSDAWNGHVFDFVTMFHVLEHLPEPRAALHSAARLLTSGGNLILQVPNVSSLQARLFRGRWYGLDVPRHLWNFTPKSLDLLLREAGFKIEAVSHFSLRDNPAAIASSLVPRLDPVGRRGGKRNTGAASRLAAELAYFGLVLLALPFALIESAVGRGGTVWVHARLKGS